MNLKAINFVTRNAQHQKPQGNKTEETRTCRPDVALQPKSLTSDLSSIPSDHIYSFPPYGHNQTFISAFLLCKEIHKGKGFKVVVFQRYESTGQPTSETQLWISVLLQNLSHMDLDVQTALFLCTIPIEN